MPRADRILQGGWIWLPPMAEKQQPAIAEQAVAEG
jgi:hypothetical protein